jgi:SAM-dependent methyltransferase
MQNTIEFFVQEIDESLKNNTFVKILINSPRSKANDLKKITIRIVEINSENKLSFLFNHKTKDITKNYLFAEGINELQKYLGIDFKNGILYTTNKDIRIQYSKKMKPKISIAKATYTELPDTSHNKKKKRFVNITGNKYLQSLGVVSAKGEVVKNKQDKYKQINKYVETIDGIIKNSSLKNKKKLRIVDMGSGKGYLTFAVYDYLVNTLKIDAKITGVEQRPDLVKLCNNIAKENNFNGLDFTNGSINSYKTDKVDILIALHACDTATDDAIYKGITSKAEVIITAPCCHKQVRKQFEVDNEFKDIVKFGILEERQAEIVTDTIRSLMLEAYEYKTQVFEFIADAHTHKNVMIVGSKSKNNTDDKSKYLEKINNLKSVFGIKYHYLEKLFQK